MDVVETDPSARFERFAVSLGVGAHKHVFKAFDQEEGVQVAWNQLRVENFAREDIARIAHEIEILRGLRNENIINLFHSWMGKTSAGKDQICFITELMTSGTLNTYIRSTMGPIKPKIIRNWGRQVLLGLNYLHTRNPQIIHRDLKCDNIFINGNNGQAKIGDLGLATVKKREHLTSVLGTPEFMAPELYDEKYDEKVILEIATKEYPYGECQNQAQIYKKVTSGIKPLVLTKISDAEIRQLIELCIETDPTKRPSTTQLLQHPFFAITPSPNNVNVSQSTNTQDSDLGEIFPVDSSSELMTKVHKESDSITDYVHHTFSITKHEATPLPGVLGSKSIATCAVDSLFGELDNLNLRMVYNTGSNPQEIKFPFDLNNDTATDVVTELVEAKLIQAVDEGLARRRIEEAVRSILMKHRSNDASNYPDRNKELTKSDILVIGDTFSDKENGQRTVACSALDFATDINYPIDFSLKSEEQNIRDDKDLSLLNTESNNQSWQIYGVTPDVMPLPLSSKELLLDVDVRLRALQEYNLLGFDNLKQSAEISPVSSFLNREGNHSAEG